MDLDYNCLTCGWPCGMCVCPEKMIDIGQELVSDWVCDSCGYKTNKKSEYVVVAYMAKCTQIGQLCKECKSSLEKVADPSIRYEFTKK